MLHCYIESVDCDKLAELHSTLIDNVENNRLVHCKLNQSFVLFVKPKLKIELTPLKLLLAPNNFSWFNTLKPICWLIKFKCFQLRWIFELKSAPTWPQLEVHSQDTRCFRLDEYLTLAQCWSLWSNTGGPTLYRSDCVKWSSGKAAVSALNSWFLSHYEPSHDLHRTGCRLAHEGPVHLLPIQRPMVGWLHPSPNDSA